MAGRRRYTAADAAAFLVDDDFSDISEIDISDISLSITMINKIQIWMTIWYQIRTAIVTMT